MAGKKSLAEGKAKPASKARDIAYEVETSAKSQPAAFKVRLESRSAVSLISPTRTIRVESVVRHFGLSKSQLAATTGLSVETLYRPKRATAARAQVRLKEMLEIIDRVSNWAGGKDQAMAWYRAESIPELGGRTAEALVKEGRAGDVRNYLDRVALGAFA